MYEIFEELLRSRGLTVYRVAKDTGLNAAMFTSWKKGTYTPKADKLKKIAEYFGVSVDYLITGKDRSPDAQAIITHVSNKITELNLSEHEKRTAERLLLYYYGLSELNRQKLLERGKELTDLQKIGGED